jgi:hypothetical protein
MTLPKHFFCQCMKPWKVCLNQKNSYKIDVRDLIDINNINYIKKNEISKLHINYDFVNKKWLQYRFNCRFLDDKKQY